MPWSLPLKHVRSPELLKAYEEIVKNLSEALEFMKVVGGEGAESLDRADIWMSHEVCSLLKEVEKVWERIFTDGGGLNFFRVGNRRCCWSMRVL